MAPRRRASFTGLAMPFRIGLSPLKVPAHPKVWHWTEPTTALFTSEVTRSDVHPARPPNTVTARMPLHTSFFIIRKTLERAPRNGGKMALAILTERRAKRLVDPLGRSVCARG